MIVSNILVFICMLSVQVTTAMTSKFLQVGVIVFDGSGQTCPKYPLFLECIKNIVAASFVFYCYAKQ